MSDVPPDGSARGPVDVLIIGAPKSGTTSLWAVLREQTWFVPPRVKELHHFSAVEPVADAVYRGWFPARTAPDQLRGEATPNYLSSYDAPARIRDHNPDVRLVVVLRDPVARAVSAYQHARRVGGVPRHASFEDVFTDEARRRVATRGWTRIRWDGMYGRHLTRYLQFFPQEQLHTMFFEDLVADPATALADLGRFLDRRLTKEGALPHENRSREVISPLVEWVTSRLVAKGRRAGVLPPDLDLSRIRGLWSRDATDPAIDPAFLRRVVEDYAADVDLTARLLDRTPPWPRFVDEVSLQLEDRHDAVTGR